MKNTLLVFVILSVMLTRSVAAKDIVVDRANFGALNSSDFADFMTELGSAAYFHPLAPAETLGITGLDVAAEVVFADVSHQENFWKFMTEDNDSISFFPVPRVHVQKGLPGRIDIGGMFAAVPDSNVKLWGAELKYGIIKGGALMPAVSARASYSQLEDVDDIDLRTYGLDLLISKGFLMLTPYGGVSALRIEGSDESGLATGWQDVEEDVVQGLAGLQFSPFPFFVINAEASFGEIPQYGIKAAIRF